MHEIGRRAGVAVLAATLLLSGHAMAQTAQEEAFPRLEIESLFELQSDWTFAAEDEESELNDLYTTIEPFLALWVTSRVALMSGLVFDRSRSRISVAAANSRTRACSSRRCS